MRLTHLFRLFYRLLLCIPLLSLLAASPVTASGGTSPSVHTLRLNPNLLRIRKTIPNLKLPEKQKKKKVKPGGPDPSSAFDLVDMVDDEALVSDLEKVAGWNPHLLFQDIEVPTLFYYLPQELRLVYDESGYLFRVQYNSMQGADKESVLVSMELKAPYHSRDVKVLEKILRSYWDPASEVKALPAFGAQADLETFTAGFSIEAGQLHLTAPSTLRQSCNLVLNLTPDQAEALIAQVSSAGVSGNLNVPLGDLPVSIPIVLAFDRFSGEILGGLKQWQNGLKVERIKNLALFPVRINSVNAFKSRGNSIHLERKSLKKQVIIKPQGAKSFRIPTVKKLFGSGVIMAWLDTEIISDCQSCRDYITKKIRGGIGTSPMETVTFDVIPNVFDQYDLYKIIIEVKSRYFSANGNHEETRELEITPGNQKPVSLNLYIPSGMDSTRFAYRLRIISSDGREFVQEQWQQGKHSNTIGTYQLKPILGETENRTGSTGAYENGENMDSPHDDGGYDDGGYYEN